MDIRAFSPGIAIVIVAAIAVGTNALGATPTGRAALCDAIQDAVKQAPAIGAPRAVEAYKALFSAMSGNDLHEIANSAAPGIALHAIGQLSQVASQRRFDPNGELTPARHIENQWHLLVPGAWAAEYEMDVHSGNETQLNRVMDYYYQRGTAVINPAAENLRDLGVRFTLARRPKRPTGGGFWVDEGTEVSVSGNLVLITQGGNSVSCDARVVAVPNKHAVSGRCYCTAVVERQTTFLAIWHDDTEPYPLYCLDTKSGRVQWETQVWGSHPMGAPYLPSGPPLRADVWVSVGETFVAVFGSDGPLYAEIFSAQSGEVVARFSTNFWAVGEPRQTMGVSIDSGED